MPILGAASPANFLYFPVYTHCFNGCVKGETVLQAVREALPTLHAKKIVPLHPRYGWDIANGTLWLEAEPGPDAIAQSAYVADIIQAKRPAGKGWVIGLFPWRQYALQAAVGIVGGLAVLGIMASGWILPAGFHLAITLISGGISLWLGKETYQIAWSDWKNRTWSMEILLAISTLASVAVSFAKLWWPIAGLPCLAEMGLLVFGFRALGSWIQLRLRQQFQYVFSNHFESDIQNQHAAAYVVPPSAVPSDGVSGAPCDFELIKNQLDDPTKSPLQPISDIPFLHALPGDQRLFIKVPRGTRAPCDGILRNADPVPMNTSCVNGRFLDHVAPHQPILQGMFAYDTDLYLEVTHSVSHSFLWQLREGILKEQHRRAQIPPTDWLHRVSLYLVPALLVIAGISGGVGAWLWGPVWGITSALSVLISVCPCALSMLPALSLQMLARQLIQQYPTLQINGIAGAQSVASHAPQIQQAIWDLNGTLTAGQPQVVRLDIAKVSDDKSESLDTTAMYTLLRDIETRTHGDRHPFGRAIVTAANTFLAQHPRTPPRAYDEKDILHAPGGVGITLDGHPYLLGNRDFIEKQLAQKKITGITLPPVTPAPCDSLETPVYWVCCKRQQILATLILRDPIRPGVIPMMRTLADRRISVAICTGADPLTANAYARAIEAQSSLAHGWIQVYAGLGADQKSSTIQKLARDGQRILFVGDGTNDSKALATVAAHGGLAVAIKPPLGPADTCDQASEWVADLCITDTPEHPVMKTLDGVLFYYPQKAAQIQGLAMAMTVALNISMLVISSGLLISWGMALSPPLLAGLMALEGLLGTAVMAMGHRVIGWGYRYPGVSDTSSQTTFCTTLWKMGWNWGRTQIAEKNPGMLPVPT